MMKRVRHIWFLYYREKSFSYYNKLIIKLPLSIKSLILRLVLRNFNKKLIDLNVSIELYCLLIS